MLFFKNSAPFKDPQQELASQLLLTPTALGDLSLPDSRTVVGAMQLMRVKNGTVFMQEGEVKGTDFMMLVIEGEVAVESEVLSANDTMVMSITGPGSLVGEMSVLDGSPRSASCTATTDLTVAVLSRDALQTLIKRQPAVAARLMLAISKRLADHLREANRKIKTLGGLSRALQEELDVAHNSSNAATELGLL